MDILLLLIPQVLDLPPGHLSCISRAEQEGAVEEESKKGDEQDHKSALKAAKTILGQEVEEAEAELQRSGMGLLVSGVLAGFCVGIGVFLVARTLTLAGSPVESFMIEFLIANAYALGFIVVIIGRMDLFTDYTTITILPVLKRRDSFRNLARFWGIVYAGNVVGAAAISLLISRLGRSQETTAPHVILDMANRLLEHEWWVVLLSATLAGWLMGLLSWLVIAGRDTISQILLIWMITVTISILGLHHSILGAIEVFAAWMSADGLTTRNVGYFLFWATVGNAIGGFLFAFAVHKSALLTSSRGQSR